MSAKRYTIAKKPPPLRGEAMLIATAVPVPGASEGADGKVPTFVPYDELGPGLYPGETVYALNTGEQVALSVTTIRMANGGGMEFRGWARVIEQDGRTLLDSAGQELELEFRHPGDAGTLQRLGPDAPAMISREIMLMMLGEPPMMTDVPVDPDAPKIEVALDASDWERHKEKAPPGTVLKPDEATAPIVPWADDVRLNASIRHAIDLASKATPLVDVAALMKTA